MGYAYLTIYVVLMVQMIPRLWQYQVELPARTVVHLSMGGLIGASCGVTPASSPTPRL